MKTMRKKISTETKLEKVKASLKEAVSATKAKAWTFQIEKQNYVVISYFAPRLGDQIAVFPSNKKGIKTSDRAILTIPNSTDHLRGFNESLRILIPEEFVEKPSELMEVIS